jgi:hypothetical protein
LVIVAELLEVGMKIGNNELLERLNNPPKRIYAWKARGSDGKDYVLRFLSSISMTTVPKTDLEPMKALPPIEGFVTWLDWEMVPLGTRVKALMMRRPYYPERLMDRFPADAANPPSKALLDIFSQLARTFDTLEKHMPELEFTISPGNLLLDGDMPILVDWGLGRQAWFIDADARAPFSSYVEPERGVPLSANYPSMWQIWYSTKSEYKYTVKRTAAQYALGALYIYLRTRLLVFEGLHNPCPLMEALPVQERFWAMGNWYTKLTNEVQAYEEKGTLNLMMLPDERERVVVERALARDESARYASCAAFVDALEGI